MNQPIGFGLIDINGNAVGAGVQGLLLWKNGTVCDDNFDNNAADAICRNLGHDSHTTWTYGNRWSIQSNYSIHMDDVKCSSNGEWSSCTYLANHNCEHHEDIFLKCNANGTGND